LFADLKYMIKIIDGIRRVEDEHSKQIAGLNRQNSIMSACRQSPCPAV
jgi:hypothetical protein